MPAFLRRAFHALVAVTTLFGTAQAQDAPAARDLFGAVSLPSVAAAQPYGFYAKGCLAGGVAVPTDGPTWQALRLSRNRRFGHPQMISLIERLSKDAAEKDGWPGLLLGDISQARGGPMKNGHASHQVGLDADIYLTPMPDHSLSVEERETYPTPSLLKKDSLFVDQSRWTPAHSKLIMRAASYQQVERIFVHPGIKKQLCETWKGDRALLGKVRPMYGHNYHFHIRIKCPADAVNCKPQAPTAPGDGCDKSLAWWFTDEPWAKPTTKPTKPAPPPRLATLADLPKSCAAVLNAPAAASLQAATYQGGPAMPGTIVADPPLGAPSALGFVPVPKARPTP